MVLVLGIVKASLEILGIGIGVKKVVLLMSAVWYSGFILTQGKVPTTLVLWCDVRIIWNNWHNQHIYLLRLHNNNSLQISKLGYVKEV